MVQFNGAGHLAHAGTRISGTPGPGITKPDRGQQAQTGGLSASVGCRNLDQNVFDITLRILHNYIEIAVLAEYSCVEEFEFWLIFSATAIFFDELRIGIRSMRILVEIVHVGVRGSTVEV